MVESWIEESKEKKEESSEGGFFSTQPLDEDKKGIDVLLFGDSSSGKTYVSHTFPEPIYIIDTEGRANKTRQYHFPNKKVKIFNPMEVSIDFKTEGEMEESIDFEKTVDNITNALIEFFNSVKEGKIKKGTLVIDSMSDLWSWIQEWGKIRLAKKGKIDLVTFRLKQQFDWGMMNTKHYRLIVTMRRLLDYGINIVGTARERRSPDYIEKPQSVTLGERIRSQKDIPFWFSTIVNLQTKKVKKGTGEVERKYLAFIEKLETFDYQGEPIENITYEKLKKLIDEKREKAMEVTR